eukprot:IDg21613t1
MEQVDMNHQLEQMRRWGRVLSRYCIACVYEIVSTRVFKENPKDTAERNMGSMKECRRGICFRMRNSCLRCMKRGHTARNYDVLTSVQESGRKMCRRCFVGRIGGYRIHRQSEFGREGACPFESVCEIVPTMLPWRRRIPHVSD